MANRGKALSLVPFDASITLKLRERDKQRVETAAHAVGLTISEYVRKVALAAARTDYTALGLDWAKD